MLATALAGDAMAAELLCSTYHDAVTNASYNLYPDWRGAVYIAAVVQPPNCTLVDGGNLKSIVVHLFGGLGDKPRCHLHAGAGLPFP